jgi:hypothetical protein
MAQFELRLIDGYEFDEVASALQNLYAGTRNMTPAIGSIYCISQVTINTAGRG